MKSTAERRSGATAERRSVARGMGAALVAAALATGCTDAGGPVDIYVITYDTAAHAFQLQAKRVETIDSVAKCAGGTTTLIKEPAVRETEDGDVEFAGGDPPNILYTEADGTIIPEDWDSLTLLSYYHHLERGASYFQDELGFAEIDAI